MNVQDYDIESNWSIRSRIKLHQVRIKDKNLPKISIQIDLTRIIMTLKLVEYKQVSLISFTSPSPIINTAFCCYVWKILFNDLSSFT
ncbi:hypothetical protein BLOT_011345 [Blomia tropicalis]|nr:hypothetical protein BLOT_011345 [Blomia tropicalis]